MSDLEWPDVKPIQELDNTNMEVVYASDTETLKRIAKEYPRERAFIKKILKQREQAND